MRWLVHTIIAFAGVVCVAALSPAIAQAYPIKSIRAIVPGLPGGSLDVVVRLMAPGLSAALGQPVVIENHAGASGVIGMQMAVGSAPDGYTLLFATTTHVIMVPLLVKNVPYDPIKDLTPIGAIVQPVVCIVAHPSVPAESLNNLIDYARRNPGMLRYSTSGIGSVFHFLGEHLKQTAGLDIPHIPYKGVPQAIRDLVAGRLELSFVSLASAKPLVAAGKLKLLAMVDERRDRSFPNVPTVAEVVPGFEKPANWYGAFGPAGLPRPIVARLNAEIVKLLNTSVMRLRFDELSVGVVGSTPEQLATLLSEGLANVGRVARTAGITLIE